MAQVTYKYIPVSVFDVEKAGKNKIRKKQDHNKVSSRATYSPFPEDVAEWCAEYFLRDSQTVFDPFAGWGQRHKAIINKEKQKEESFADVITYIKSKFSAYFTLMVAASFIVALLYTFQAWVPTYIARIHGWELSRVGYLFGIVTLISGSLGVLSGPVLERFLDRKCFTNSTHAVFLISASTLAVIPALIFISIPESLVLPGMFIISFFITLPMACFASGLQKMTPQNYRGSISGLYVFMMNIVGLSLGPTVVPFFTSVIFQSDMSINLALSYTFLIFGPLSFSIFFLGRKALIKELQAEN